MKPYKAVLSDEEIKASAYGTFIGLFIGRMTIDDETQYSSICYLLRNKSGERFILPRTVTNGKTSVSASSRMHCDQVDLMVNINVPDDEWNDLRVKEVMRKL